MDNDERTVDRSDIESAGRAFEAAARGDGARAATETQRRSKRFIMRECFDCGGRE